MTPRELEQQLAEAEAAETQLRAVIDTLLAQGEAVFASRRWRLGAALLRPLEILLRACGRDVPEAQDAAHWRALAGAQLDAIARRRALLRQLSGSGECDAETAVARLWQEVAAEHATRGDAATSPPP